MQLTVKVNYILGFILILNGSHSYFLTTLSKANQKEIKTRAGNNDVLMECLVLFTCMGGHLKDTEFN